MKEHKETGWQNVGTGWIWGEAYENPFGPSVHPSAQGVDGDRLFIIPGLSAGQCYEFATLKRTDEDSLFYWFSRQSL